MTQIKIIRGSYLELFRNYNVTVNGEKRKLGINNFISYNLDDNERKIDVSVNIDWISNSKEFQIENHDRDTYIIKISPNPLILFSVYTGMFFVILSLVTDWTVLRFLTAIFGIILFLSISLYRSKYFSIKLM